MTDPVVDRIVKQKYGEEPFTSAATLIHPKEGSK